MSIYEIFIINSLVIFGVFATTGPDMIFGFMQRQFVTHDWLRKPLFDCPPCMASLWGTVGFLFTGLAWYWWPVYVFALSGFNYIVNKLLRNG